MSDNRLYDLSKLSVEKRLENLEATQLVLQQTVAKLLRTVVTLEDDLENFKESYARDCRGED